MNTYVILNIFFCFFMTGIIWLVQVLIYPSFKIVPGQEIARFHDHHSKRITMVVAPAMVAELATAGFLCLKYDGVWNFVNLGSVLVLWGLTAFISVPIHDRIHKNPSETIHKLIQTNWLRTIMWSVRSGVWVWYLWNV